MCSLMTLQQEQMSVRGGQAKNHNAPQDRLSMLTRHLNGPDIDRVVAETALLLGLEMLHPASERFADDLDNGGRQR